MHEMNLLKIYIVEDDPFFGESLKYHLKLNPDYDVHLFDTGKKCIENLYLKPDIICLDFGLPDISGDKLLNQIKEFNPKIPVIIISGQDEIEVAVDFLKAGARDYIVKNSHTKDILWNSILKIRENKERIREIQRELEKIQRELEKIQRSLEKIPHTHRENKE